MRSTRFGFPSSASTRPRRADGTTQMHLEVTRAGADIGDHVAVGETRRCDDQPGSLPLVAVRLVEVCPLLGGAAVVVVAMLCTSHPGRRMLSRQGSVPDVTSSAVSSALIAAAACIPAA